MGVGGSAFDRVVRASQEGKLDTVSKKQKCTERERAREREGWKRYIYRRSWRRRRRS